MTSIAYALTTPPESSMMARPEPGHVLGDVYDDWEAAEVWLTTVRLKSRNGSAETEKTYRYHLAKLKWYCENIGRVTPSRWSVQDVEHFIGFLKKLPDDALCPKGVSATEPGWTPFQRRP
ncbi:MAG: hypothetical protein H7315_13130, partial [Herminiimonas sp.]|nr:hypothetical protein [Herminiimonas sp.]